MSVRPEAHRIDTMARGRVAVALPSGWEPRETTGRDYGVDMQVELFDEGSASGSFLLLQIKGTGQDVPIRKETVFPGTQVDMLTFRLPVRTLKYAELFIAPVLLAVCPVNEQPPTFYYLWLQEYIRVVLDHEEPGWRGRGSNSTITVKIPSENKMPGREAKLAAIAKFPKRLFEWTQIARISEMIPPLVAPLKQHAPVDQASLQRLLSLMEEVRDLPATFNDRNWKFAQRIRSASLEPSIKAVKLLLRGGPYTVQDIWSMESGVGEETLTDDQPVSQEDLRAIIGNVAAWADLTLISALARANDYDMRRSHWLTRGIHDF